VCGYPLLQADVARWLGTQFVGTPASHIHHMSQRGFAVTYDTGSLTVLETWLQRQMPLILFLRTGDLPHWSVDTPHAIVLAGFNATTPPSESYLFDPGLETGPSTVSTESLLLAWSHFDYTYAILSLP
jgi:hypothetical protein